MSIRKRGIKKKNPPQENWENEVLLSVGYMCVILSGLFDFVRKPGQNIPQIYTMDKNKHVYTILNITLLCNTIYCKSNVM